MDEFKYLLNKQCGIGGLRCYCCNPSKAFRSTKSKNRNKTIMNKIARRRIKSITSGYKGSDYSECD